MHRSFDVAASQLMGQCSHACRTANKITNLPPPPSPGARAGQAEAERYFNTFAGLPPSPKSPDSGSGLDSSSGSGSEAAGASCSVVADSRTCHQDTILWLMRLKAGCFQHMSTEMGPLQEIRSIDLASRWSTGASSETKIKCA